MEEVSMYMVRTVMNCKPGKVGELVGKFKALSSLLEEQGQAPFRLYTDVAGEPFWTLVAEREYETMNAMHDDQARFMSDERAQAAMAGYHDLVVSGRREIYKVEG
jgi:hypothetical protein